MFKALFKWWYGELVEVEIIECRGKINHFYYEHTLVHCQDGTRQIIRGHRGRPGEKIKVYEGELQSF